MSYRKDWADAHGHVWIVVRDGARCFFCGVKASSKTSTKDCKENPEWSK